MGNKSFFLSIRLDQIFLTDNLNLLFEDVTRMYYEFNVAQIKSIFVS